MNIWLIILGVIGLVVGGVFALRRFESMAGKTNEQLRDILHGSDFLFYRNALVELRKRGEDISQEVLPILDLLVSDDRDRRTVGSMILRELYPDLAARISDYKPFETPDICRQKIQKIFIKMKLTG